MVFFRLIVLLLIRRGLNELNNQLRKVIKLLPECARSGTRTAWTPPWRGGRWGGGRTT